MKEKKTKKIDFGYERLADLADKYYNDGKLFSALKIAHKQYGLHGGDGNVYVRLADIYEGMGLHASALNYWYKFLDIAEEQDLSEIYEGIAVNYLNTGNESASAYYYNKLMDTDDTLPDEVKMDIVDAFSKEKNCIGKEVVQMTFNPQAIGGGFSGNGGDGWLRLLEFMPDKKTVKATTFSPFVYGSTSTTHLAWKNDPANCFTFTLE